MRSARYLLAGMIALGQVMTTALPAKAQNFQVLWTFTGGPDGGGPFGGVVLDAQGNLYGATQAGGNANCGGGCGVVFKLSKSGTESPIYSFTGKADGGNPYSGVIRDSAGNLYGTASGGGASNRGVVFRINNAEKEAVFSFNGGNGASPFSELAQDTSGNLYGTTYVGGFVGGTVFRLNKAGKITFYRFCSRAGCSDGSNPRAGVVLDSAGNIYGTTLEGGSANCNGGCGVVFEVTTAGKEIVLHQFCPQPGCTDGKYPYGGVALDASGNVYGTTQQGGLFGAGTVFEVNKSGTETVVYNFCSQPGCADGQTPDGTVILDSQGNLYGTTYFGGTFGNGTVFKIGKDGGESVLYSFSGGSDGSQPVAGVTLDNSGNLYGTTLLGGIAPVDSGEGVVFELTAQ